MFPVANNTKAKLSADIISTDTTIAVDNGSLFSENMVATLEHKTGGEITKREMILITGISGNNLTVTRAYAYCVVDDSTNPKVMDKISYSFDEGDEISVYMSSEVVQEIISSGSDIDVSSLKTRSCLSYECYNTYHDMWWSCVAGVYDQCTGNGFGNGSEGNYIVPANTVCYLPAGTHNFYVLYIQDGGELRFTGSGVVRLKVKRRFSSCGKINLKGGDFVGCCSVNTPYGTISNRADQSSYNALCIGCGGTATYVPKGGNANVSGGTGQGGGKGYPGCDGGLGCGGGGSGGSSSCSGGGGCPGNGENGGNGGSFYYNSWGVVACGGNGGGGWNEGKGGDGGYSCTRGSGYCMVGGNGGNGGKRGHGGDGGVAMNICTFTGGCGGCGGNGYYGGNGGGSGKGGNGGNGIYCGGNGGESTGFTCEKATYKGGNGGNAVNNMYGLILEAREILCYGCIDGSGGSGGNGGNGGCSGDNQYSGSPGGNGGNGAMGGNIAVAYYRDFNCGGCVDVSGGTGGSAGKGRCGCSDGTAGTSGAAGTYIYCDFKTINP